MDEDRPTQAEWLALFEAAGRVKALAPWEWMTEEDVFGVRDPEAGEIGFVSVMGRQGEHFGISVYRGVEGLSGFAYVQTVDLEAYPEMLFEIPQLQASFEDRETLRAEERALIKELGLRFRGRKAWPQFQSFRPGFLPWLPDALEARVLTRALEQLLEVAPRVREDPALLRSSGEGNFFVRVPGGAGGDGWSDRVEHVESPPPTPIPVCWNAETLEALTRLKPSGMSVAVDFFLLPAPIAEEGKRPVFPYVLLVVDAESGIVVATDILSVQESPEEMWGRVPAALLEVLNQAELLPGELRVRSDLLATVLKPVAEELQVPLTLFEELDELDRAKHSLFERLL